MIGAWEQRKLAELRAKTDRDLLILICRGLDRAYRRSAEGLHQDAVRTYRQSDLLLSKVYSCKAAEWLRLEACLKELRQRLGAPFTEEAPLAAHAGLGLEAKALGA